MKNICIFTLLFFLAINIFAQEKRGKPNLDAYDDILKEAKKGNVSACLTIGGVCQGNFFAKPEFRDFKESAKWYEKINSADDPAGVADRNLFALYHLGGFGILADEERAKKYYQSAIAKSDVKRIYEDKINLYFKDFYTLKAQAELGDKNAQILLARQYFEFGISYVLAMDWIKKTLDLPDGAYLEEKWQAMKRRYDAYGNSKLPDLIAYGIMSKYAEKGSFMAKLELAWAGLKAKDSNAWFSPSRSAQSFENFKTDSKELEFKILYTLTQNQRSYQRFITLRRFANTDVALNEEERKYSLAAFNEFNDWERTIQNLIGFGEFIRKQGFSEIPLEMIAYRNGFEGDVKKVLAFYQQLQNPMIKDLAGEKLHNNYLKELAARLPEFMQLATNDPVKLIDFKNAFENDLWLKNFKTQNQEKLAQLMTVSGINSENLSLYEEMSKLNTSKFNNLTEGKNYFDVVSLKFMAEQKTRESTQKASKTKLTPEQQAQNLAWQQDRNKFLDFVKAKTIQDLMGENPEKEKIEKMTPTLRTTMWLQPVGSEKFLYYTNNSPNWFTGEVKRKNVHYHYKLTRKANSTDYELTVNAVVQNEASIVFSSLVKSFDKTREHGEYEVYVYDARYANYRWQPKESDYVKVLYSPQNDQILSFPMGGVNNHLDTSHGLSAQAAHKKVAPADFSEKTAIRSAVQYFILEYNRAIKH